MSETRKQLNRCEANLALLLVGVNVAEVILGELEGDSQQVVQRVENLTVQGLGSISLNLRG